MKNKDLIKAIKALTVIMPLRLPYEKAKAIFNLFREIEPEYQFIAQEERKLVGMYASKNLDGSPKTTRDGSIIFDKESKKMDYIAEQSALMAMESEKTYEVIHLSRTDIGEQTIAVETMLDLDGLVIFD